MIKSKQKEYFGDQSKNRPIAKDDDILRRIIMLSEVGKPASEITNDYIEILDGILKSVTSL